MMDGTENGVETGEVAPFDPLSMADHDEAERRLTEVRRGCPVSRPHPHMHFVARHADVERVLLDNATFSARSNFRLDPVNGARLARASGALPTLDPPVHTDVRRRLRRWFEPRALRQLQPRVRELAAVAVAALPTGVAFDMVVVGKRLAAQVVYALIGAPEHHWPQLQEWSDALHERLPAPLEGAPEYSAVMALLRGLLDGYRQGDLPPDETVLSGLATAVEAGELPAAEALVHVWQLVQAGTETTGGLIANLLHALLSERSRWQLLLERPDLVVAAIEESLRHDAPLQYVMRTPNEPVGLSGTTIDVDDQVVIGLQAANWDHEAWGADALEFRIERDHPARHFSFGKGAHICLGAPLARMEAKAFVDELCRRRPRIELAAGYVHELAPELMVRRPEELLLYIPS